MTSASETQVLEQVRSIFEEIPFNRYLGLKITRIEPDAAEVEFDMRDVLCGNYMRGILHGGVVSAALDAVAGIAVFAHVVTREGYVASQDNGERFARIGTIDLRVDYLRPGRGDRFRADAKVVRAGNSIAVLRMEFYDADQQTQVAVGTCAYFVG